MVAPGSGFHWAPRDASGNELGPTRVFDTREEAEAWLSEGWADLLASGAERVELVCEGRVVYEMGLRPQ